jgi:hypothetical protein
MVNSEMLVKNKARILLLVASVLLFQTHPFAAAQRGQVTLGGVPVPGATVTATQGDTRVQTITDQDGAYQFPELTGAWTIRVEMLGFEPASRDVIVAADLPPLTWELKLLSFDQIATAGAAAAATPKGPSVGDSAERTPDVPNAGSSAGPPGFQRAVVSQSTPTPPATMPAAVSATPAPANNATDDGFLINGSVNNGAASPFAQLPAFGNNRRGARSLYNGGVAVLLNSSAFDSRPFSFTNQPTPKPSYTDIQVSGSFAGPIPIPGMQNKLALFLGYQHTLNHNVTTQSALVPTLLERSGDFSQTLDGLGQPVHLVDPKTGVAFPGNVIPLDRISPQAAALLAYYPQPNLVESGGQFNYQTPVLSTTRQDAVQARFNQMIDTRNQLFGMFAYQRMTTDAANVFGFVDSTHVSGVDTTLNWSHRLSPVASIRLHYQFTQLATDVTPFFANQTNVSGDAGIAGNAQTPNNWGPPALIFSSGVAGLSDAQSALNTTTTHIAGVEQFWGRGQHNFTFGGEVRPQFWNANADQNPRGTFSFTGNASGSDVADFLLGIPHTMAVAFGNSDKRFYAVNYDAYVTDDWRVRSFLTINVGVRWEYEPPVEERSGRLANLVLTPDFTAGSVSTGNGLIHPDRRGIQPRIGVAWRPIPGSSLLIRGGYGIYRNSGAFEPIALLLAQQASPATSFSIENSGAFTLANGFLAPRGAAPVTFAVDPDFRVGYAQNWQVLMQRDLPSSLTFTATYLGAKGSHLMQEFLPNTYPAGIVNPCSSCPTGFVYLTSNGTSLKNAGQLQLRRRLRAGLSASVQYTLSKATDDAGAFTGVNLTGAAIAQDWLNLEAERGPSNYDQRHLLAAQVEYTTGVGVAGGGLLTGMKGTLFKGWTVTSQLNAGSGLPLTPVLLTSVAGTGVTGTLRPALTGVSADPPPGYYLNPTAYAVPAPGQWGNAGRNSARGPQQFSLNGSVGRTFLFGDRLNLDWRLDVTNLLNRVTYASVNTIVGSPQFGLPTVANPMRRIQSTMRLRF